MPAHDSDYYQLETIAGRVVARVPVKENALDWPPPQTLALMGVLWQLESHSAISDAQIATMTHVARGALYRPAPAALQPLEFMQPSSPLLH